MGALLSAVASAMHWHRTRRHAQQEAAAEQALHLQVAYAKATEPVTVGLASRAPSSQTKRCCAHHLHQRQSRDTVGDLVGLVTAVAGGGWLVCGGVGRWTVSMRPASFQQIPPVTVRMASAGCPRGTPATLIRDRLDVLFEDEEFADLCPADGRPGLSPGQLALVSVLQFAENLSDRAATDAVRTRIDCKYGLGLELDDPGFDYSVLSEFRTRLAEGDRADQLLQLMLDRLVAAGLLKGRVDSVPMPPMSWRRCSG
ncbi:transposase [Streptomyces sp. NPDC001663]|uniref:transposase n=1 Tax=Streptomyces sp. NPDC001663 TaxID=3364597 RepID=UPI00369C3400